MEILTRDIENVPLTSWYCAQLVSCCGFQPLLWERDRGWKGLPGRVRFSLLALCVSIYQSRSSTGTEARGGRGFLFNFFRLHPPNATSAASCQLQDDLNEEQIVPWPASLSLWGHQAGGP